MTLMILCSIYGTLENIRISSLKMETVAIFCQEVLPSLFIPTHTNTRPINRPYENSRENRKCQFKDVPRDNHKPPTTSQSFTHSRCHLLTSLFCTCLLLFFDVVILVILCYIFKRWLIMWLVHHIINVSIYSIHPNRHPWVNQPTIQPTTHNNSSIYLKGKCLRMEKYSPLVRYMNSSWKMHFTLYIMVARWSGFLWDFPGMSIRL